jgi:hypothetical protein
MYSKLTNYFKERHRSIRGDGVAAIEANIKRMGLITSIPFIVRFLLPEERIDPLDEEEWEAIDCNNRVVAMTNLDVTEYPTYRVVKPSVGNEPLSWKVLELLASAENEKHDKGAVHATPFEKLLRVVRLLSVFSTKVEGKLRVDYEGMRKFLVKVIPRHTSWALLFILIQTFAIELRQHTRFCG